MRIPANSETSPWQVNANVLRVSPPARVRCWRTARGYRARAFQLGDRYLWESAQPDAEPVIVGIDSRCSLWRDELDELFLLCRDTLLVLTLMEALTSGWAWLASPADEDLQVETAALHLRGGQAYASPRAGSIPALVQLADGVRAIAERDGQVSFFRGLRRLGIPFSLAVHAGWCRTWPPETVAAALLPEGEAPLAPPRPARDAVRTSLISPGPSLVEGSYCAP